MAFPAFVKTWTTSFNNAVAAGTDAARLQQSLVKKLKDLLLTAGWIVAQSCNAGVVSGVNYGDSGGSGGAACDAIGGSPPVAHGTTPSGTPPAIHYTNTVSVVNGTDSWVTAGVNLVQVTVSGVAHISVANDVNPGVAGVRHSWCVLTQTGGMATGTVSLLLDMNTAGSGCGVYFSPTAGFTGGTVTNRPTATDEQTINATFLNTGTNAAHKVHLWYSSDHACTRVMFARGGLITGFLMLDKVQSPVTGWTYPLVCAASYITGGAANAFAALTVTSVLKMFGNSGTTGTASLSTSFQGSTTFEAFATNSPLATAAGIGTAVNSFDSSWPVLPMGVASNAVANQGRLGGLFDIWHSPTGVTDSDTATNATNGVVKLGGTILPWDGATAVLLT